MFAVDIGLLPDNALKGLLAKLDGNPHGFPVLIGKLWEEMAKGWSETSSISPFGTF